MATLTATRGHPVIHAFYHRLLARGKVQNMINIESVYYVFDKWMDRTFPDHPWARYADDGVVHCRTEAEARQLLAALQERFKACGLALHPDKTRIVYCKDDDRRGDYPETQFDFLGYTFRPRRAKNRYGKFFVSFTPGVSNEAAKDMRQRIHDCACI
jgi:RNA-directed DNA polymerase